MKKIDFGQVVQLLANVGVIAGIVFLAFELRQLDEQMASQSRFNYYSTRIANLTTLAESPYLAPILAKKLAGEIITPEEEIRLDITANVIYTSWEYEFGEFAEDRLVLGDLDVPGKRRLYRNPALPFQEIYEQLKQSREEDSPFIEFMEEYIVNP